MNIVQVLETGEATFFVFDVDAPLSVLSEVRQGPPGRDAGSVLYAEDEFTYSGSANLTLSSSDWIAGSLAVAVNGLRQPRSFFSALGNALTLNSPAGYLEAGDAISVTYVRYIPT